MENFSFFQAEFDVGIVYRWKSGAVFAVREGLSDLNLRIVTVSYKNKNCNLPGVDDGLVLISCDCEKGHRNNVGHYNCFLGDSVTALNFLSTLSSYVEEFKHEPFCFPLCVHIDALLNKLLARDFAPLSSDQLRASLSDLYKNWTKLSVVGDGSTRESSFFVADFPKSPQLINWPMRPESKKLYASYSPSGNLWAIQRPTDKSCTSYKCCCTAVRTHGVWKHAGPGSHCDHPPVKGPIFFDAGSG